MISNSTDSKEEKSESSCREDGDDSNERQEEVNRLRNITAGHQNKSLQEFDGGKNKSHRLASSEAFPSITFSFTNYPVTYPYL